jgi:hypothetical protein
MNRAEAIIAFHDSLTYRGGPLPEGVEVMNPYQENPAVKPVSDAFYRRFYSDERPRKLILGINPGRLGAGATGIPFTDTKRFEALMGTQAGIGQRTHEPSSVFVYAVVETYGGAEKFFGDFYIHSVCPLGFTIRHAGKQPVNYNYYDSSALQAAVLPFIQWNLREQIRLAGSDERCFCLGSGKNSAFLSALNAREKLFGEVVPMDHPRFIMQYKAKHIQSSVDQWLETLCK